MFNFKLPLSLEPEKNWHNAENDDDDDSGQQIWLDRDWISAASLIIYAACSLDCMCA